MNILRDKNKVPASVCVRCGEIFRRMARNEHEAVHIMCKWPLALLELGHKRKQFDLSNRVPTVQSTNGDKRHELQKLDIRMQDIQREYEALQNELHRLEALEDEVTIVEDATFQRHLDMTHQNTLTTNTLETLEESLESVSGMLDNASTANVLEDAFRILIDAHGVASINGFRLGVTGTSDIDWSELNAGLGQVALAVQTLADKTSFRFMLFQIHYQGSTTTMFNAVDQSGAALHSTGPSRTLDKALSRLCECVSELGQHFALRDKSFALPHKIKTDRIFASGDEDAGVSIRFSADVSWVRAMRYLLVNILWMMAWLPSLPPSDSWPPR